MDEIMRASELRDGDSFERMHRLFIRRYTGDNEPLEGFIGVYSVDDDINMSIHPEHTVTRFAVHRVRIDPEGD